MLSGLDIHRTGLSMTEVACNRLPHMDVMRAGDVEHLQSAIQAMQHCLAVSLPDPNLICAACLFLGSIVGGELAYAKAGCMLHSLAQAHDLTKWYRFTSAVPPLIQ